MEQDFEIPPIATTTMSPPPESTLTKSLLKSALDWGEDFQPPIFTQPVQTVDLDYDFRMCNIVNPETARLRQSQPKTASLLRFSSLSHICSSDF